MIANQNPISIGELRFRRPRENLEAELALEFVLNLGRDPNAPQITFWDLLEEARLMNTCDEEDLIAWGWHVFHQLQALDRGEITELTIERRLPRRGEYGRPDPA